MLLLMMYEPLFEQRKIMNIIDSITLVITPPPSVNNGIRTEQNQNEII